jgi:hypothetical protein
VFFEELFGATSGSRELRRVDARDILRTGTEEPHVLPVTFDGVAVHGDERKAGDDGAAGKGLLEACEPVLRQSQPSGSLQRRGKVRRMRAELNVKTGEG